MNKKELLSKFTISIYGNNLVYPYGTFCQYSMLYEHDNFYLISIFNDFKKLVTCEDAINLVLALEDDSFTLNILSNKM